MPKPPDCPAGGSTEVGSGRMSSHLTDTLSNVYAYFVSIFIN